MTIKNYNTFLLESMVSDDIISNLPDEYNDVKADIIGLIDDTLSDINDDYKRSDFDKFVNDYLINGKDDVNINGLIDDNDIFNFYMKHQSDIDEFLNSDGYLEETPKEHDSFGLHETLIDGTKYLIFNMIEQIKDAL